MGEMWALNIFMYNTSGFVPLDLFVLFTPTVSGGADRLQDVNPM